MKKMLQTIVVAMLLLASCRVTAQNNHYYVNLGLPSGTRWATCNVGADKPEELGRYFAWGEKDTKSICSWSNYRFGVTTKEGEWKLRKYCPKPDYAYNGIVHPFYSLIPEDDAATANWGKGWSIPTEKQWEELIQHTTCKWTTRNGVKGMLFTSSNGESIFLPAAGENNENGIEAIGSYGIYWSNHCNSDDPMNAILFDFYEGNCWIGSGVRYYGHSIRPVRSAK